MLMDIDIDTSIRIDKDMKSPSKKLNMYFFAWTAKREGGIQYLALLYQG